MTSENAKNLARMGFSRSTTSTVYEHGPVIVTHAEAVRYDWPYLKHLIESRAKAADYLTELYAKKRP